jgi:hypothetical protein
MSSVLRGLPDLGAPLGSGFAAFERTGLAIAVPDVLDLQRRPDGSAVLLITLERSLAFGPIGRLEVGFAAHAVAVPDPLVPVAPAEISGGVLEVTALLGPVAERRLVPPLVLAPDQLTRGRIVTVLSPEAAVVASQLITDATLPVTAALRLFLPAVAARVPFETRFDPRRLAGQLTRRFGTAATVMPDELGEALDELLGGDPGASREDLLRREVLTLRLADLFAVPEPGAELRYRLRPETEVAQGDVHHNLARPATVTAHRLLTLDPLAKARALSGGSLEQYVRRITMDELPTGHVPVTFVANLPEPVAGLLKLYSDLRVPPTPPKRPQQVTASVELPAPGRTASATVVLAPGETLDGGALNGEVRLRGLVMSADEPVELAGPWQPAAARHLTLGRSAFPLPLKVVRASDGLLRLATVEIRTVSEHSVGRLDTETPTVAVPEFPDDRLARVVLTPLGPGRAIDLPMDESQRLDLDLALLPGFGGHSALVVSLSPPAVVEWRPEGAAEAKPQSVRLTAQRPEAEIGWVATSPFQPGVQWRIVSDGTAGPWSAPVAPAAGLAITVDQPEPVVVTGIELRPEPAEPGVWTYVPPGPFLDSDPQGRLAIGLIEAGDIAFLQVTSRLDLSQEARAAVLTELREQVPGRRADEVRPAPIDVRMVAVQERPEQGEWHTLAEGKSSGLPPWNTALSATLTADQTAAVKASLQGAKDRLRLVAEVTPLGGAQQTRTKDVADLVKTD